MKLFEIIKYIVDKPNSAFFYTPPIYKNAQSYLFKNVSEEVKIYSPDELNFGFAKIDELISLDLTAFGYIEYELGYLLEQRLEHYSTESEKPLLHFSFCDSSSIEIIKSTEIDYSGFSKLIGKKIISDFKINTSKQEYIKNVEKIKKYIKEGDTYQVNYTVKGSFKLTSKIEELFAQLIFSQSAEYTAIMNLDDRIIVSSSPELFLELIDHNIKVKPMKGTIARGINTHADEINQSMLLDSAKDRAENIMIVDLLRNDIGKICEYGSVEVKNKYKLEKYESVFQLTSEIVGKLKTNSISEIIKNLFPSGSITGAPKLRTMEIIHELEKSKRGVYTGLIGMFNKNHSITNVAIRTLDINKSSMKGELGIGSGVVWDSDPELEYEEVLLKSNFLTQSTKYFELFETMLLEDGVIFLFENHLYRLKDASQYFLFNYDEKFVRSELSKHIYSLDKNKLYKIRLSLSKWGNITITNEIISPNSETVDLRISDKKIDSHNKYQFFKTTNRELYERELRVGRKNGFFETIFFNEKEQLAEGCITNILVEFNNATITPPINAGILNGCYRQFMLDNKSIQEQHINIQQLINSKRIILINSVRKEVKVDRLFDSKGNLLRDFT
ncbi:MAG: aminodeoxychorismate synthase component I [Melioribacteraceae bacterium]|nr:MAG: aminodeoxychorismate synthase component I [Melioribacteraceae bacterium]